MQVRYTLSTEDYVIFVMQGTRNNLWFRRGLLVAWFGPTLLSAAIAVALAFLDEWYHHLGAVFAGFFSLMYVGLYPFEIRRLLEEEARTHARKTRGLTGVNTLILSEELFVEITETMRVEIKWQELKDVKEVGDRTYISFHGWTTVFPRLGLDSDEEYFAVRDLALRKLAEKVTPRPQY